METTPKKNDIVVLTHISEPPPMMSSVSIPDMLPELTSRPAPAPAPASVPASVLAPATSSVLHEELPTTHVPILSHCIPIVTPPQQTLSKPILIHELPLMHDAEIWDIIALTRSSSTEDAQFDASTNTVTLPVTPLTAAQLLTIARTVLTQYPEAPGLAISTAPMPILDAPADLLDVIYRSLDDDSIWISTYALKVLLYNHRTEANTEKVDTVISRALTFHGLLG